MRLRSFAQEQIMPLARAEMKNRTVVQQPPAQRSGLISPRCDTERLQRTFQILWKGLVLRPSCYPQAAISLSRGYHYFFFFEVFFATFLVAAFAVFFAFFAFLAMSSSAKTGSVNMSTPCIDMRNIETISQMQN